MLCSCIPNLKWLSSPVSKTYRDHHHYDRVAGEGRCVAPAPWPCRTACLQSSTGEVFESRRTWSILRARGRPGRRFQSRQGWWPTDRSTFLRSAMWSGTSFSSRAICPKTKMRRAAIYRMSLRVRARTSMLLTKSNQRIPIVSVAGISCGKPLMLSCLLQGESTFLLHISVQRAPDTYTRSLVVSARRWSFQIWLSEAITEEASPIRRLRSSVQYPSDDCRLPR